MPLPSTNTRARQVMTSRPGGCPFDHSWFAVLPQLIARTASGWEKTVGSGPTSTQATELRVSAFGAETPR
jgi:hypothetical protein